jgi:hypothetical protein
MFLEMGRGAPRGVWCSPDCWSWQQWWWWWQQQQQGEMVPNFLSITCGGETFQWIGVLDFESLSLAGALFLLDGGRKREGKKKEKKKKNHCGEEHFPGAGPTLLPVQWITAIRCN